MRLTENGYREGKLAQAKEESSEAPRVPSYQRNLKMSKLID